MVPSLVLRHRSRLGKLLTEGRPRHTIKALASARAFLMRTRHGGPKGKNDPPVFPPSAFILSKKSLKSSWPPTFDNGNGA
jgi:hypothetical protein